MAKTIVHLSVDAGLIAIAKNMRMNMSEAFSKYLEMKFDLMPEGDTPEEKIKWLENKRAELNEEKDRLIEELKEIEAKKEQESLSG